MKKFYKDLMKQFYKDLGYLLWALPLSIIWTIVLVFLIK